MESALNNIIEKISSYEIFNNIIPGVVYSVFTEKLTRFQVSTENLFANIVLLYFIGLVIGRIGSIFSDFIGWCLRKLGWKSFLNFAPYSDYIAVERKDEKGRIRNLVAISNMYRTFFSLAVCLICTIVLDGIWHTMLADNSYKIIAVVVILAFLAILFVFSYRKQTAYITKRIFAILEQERNESRNG